MIACVFKKVWTLLKGKPVALWGLSWLAAVLSWVAWTGFWGVPILAFVVSIVLQAALARVFLDACKGKTPQTRDLFAPFVKGRFAHVAKGMAWMYLWVFLWGLVPLAGPVLAAIKLYTYRFVPYILVTRPEIRAADALQASAQETRGYRGKLFCADLLVFLAVLVPALLLGLLAAIPFVSGLFVFLLVLFCLFAAAFWSLVTGLLRAVFYEEIQHCLADPEYRARYIAPAVPYIPAGAQPAPSPTPEMPVSMRNCPVCGMPAASSAKFCANCGTSLDEPESKD